MIERLFDLLPEGEESAVGAAQLAALMGLQDTRSLRRLIELARRRGYLILSCECGYFKPSGDGEVQRFVHAMSKRVATTSAVTKAARRYLKERAQLDSGQLTIFDVLDAADGDGGL